MERLLPKCLDSLLSQEHDALEIILINDGSTDSSGKICSRYSESDERIIVIHKENGGVSSARNIGLSKATGSFVSFIDPDDWLENDMYSKLCDLARTESSDIVMCGYYQEKENNTVPLIKQVGEIIVYGPAEAMNEILDSKKFRGYLWNKLFNLELIRKNKVEFDEDIHFCEDMLFCAEAILHAERISYDSTPLYHYMIHEQNTSNSKYSKKKLTALEAINKIINLVSTETNVNLKQFKTYFVHMNISLLMNGMHEKKCTSNLRKKLKSNLFVYKLNDINDNSVKIFCILGRISTVFSYQLWKIIK